MIYQRSARRHGFTLTELLVVISIIAILGSLITAFIFSAADRARASNTEHAIQTINKLFQHHWSQVVADAKKEDISDTSELGSPNPLKGFGNLIGLAGADPSFERTRIILMKLRLMEAFPVRYGEVNNVADPVYLALKTYLPQSRRKYTSTYRKVLVDANKKPLMAANDPLTESSACLLMALSEVKRGGPDFPKDAMVQSIADSDGDGIKEFVDGWSQRPAPAIPPYTGEVTPGLPGKPQPLRFYRFAWSTPAYNATHPILSPAPSGAAASPYPDPLDPLGTLQNANWYASAQRATFESAIGCALRDPTNQNNFIIPVIASAGSDGYFGLPVDIRIAAPAGLLNVLNTGESDNIYNYTLRNQ